MIRRTADASPAVLAAFDAVIDVRSPSEFAEDHLPGAINLPVLDDAQRAEVGTEYVRGSKFLARRRGAALVARNIAAHLDGALSDRPAGFRPLVHCWRGGQRSHAMATVMDQVGWPVAVLDGGYRTWRRQVVHTLYDHVPPHSFVLIDGPTGVGKTAMLTRLSQRGVQTLDLEALANHRGSLFGARPGGQPGQKRFDSLLAAALAALDPSRPVAVEAESSRIGRLNLPVALWSAMRDAPRLELRSSMPDRISRILKDYAAVAADPEAIAVALARLPRHISKGDRAAWLDLARRGRLDEFVAGLIRGHYDPAYARGRRSPPVAVLPAEDVGAVAAALSDPEMAFRPPA